MILSTLTTRPHSPSNTHLSTLLLGALPELEKLQLGFVCWNASDVASAVLSGQNQTPEYPEYITKITSQTAILLHMPETNTWRMK